MTGSFAVAGTTAGRDAYANRMAAPTLALTSRASTTNNATRVARTVTQARRKPNSPNHNQSTYASNNGATTNNTVTRPTNAVTSVIRARRESIGTLPDSGLAIMRSALIRWRAQVLSNDQR
ncbi:hypothetical protein MMAGJ_21080 [Mycolicibacterium mageritense]|uniref:Uncharacterized protein n=1 Tax=Mycolicibacterium mageritense TaxID=53462 RepID=A0ABM7HQK8_MYCME|nr:hypothetical protein MMAGJ_21080 [Mycolicibacterium mageritense]